MSKPRKYREFSEAEIQQAITYSLMTSHDFTTARRREWEIWAAKFQPCPLCGAREFSPCLNMADVKSGAVPRTNRYPHPSRIDWSRLLNGLKDRGLYRAVIEEQTRRRMIPNGS